ncbi:hypothetical protein SEMRO_52_G030900.1 [Seminavis robusta]|uniref:Uncharacterized protein n=1 Tax=Seminavis robusta TaxID=568900 RepID=A0A9N8DA06_9STRA|nr:hypothetical protein SEMRO_52_G030900.1 [Seminavis robusta]|eukprot:Sro52_g030900.1 n/a (213) ;mRNA; f:37215-37853
MSTTSGSVANDEEEEFDVLDVVAARIASRDEAELQKLEAGEMMDDQRRTSQASAQFSQNATTSTTVAITQTLSDKPEEHKAARGYGKNEDVRTTSNEPTTQEDPREQEESVPFLLKIVRERQEFSKLASESDLDLPEVLSVPQPTLTREPNVAPAMMRPGAYLAAPGTELQRATTLCRAFVGAPSSSDHLEPFGVTEGELTSAVDRSVSSHG